MYWNRELETIDRTALEQLQVTRLRDTVRRVAQNVPFYRTKLAEQDVQAGQHPVAGGCPPVAIHHERGSTGQLSDWPDGGTLE